MYGGWGWGMMFGMIVFWVLLVIAVMYFFRWNSSRYSGDKKESALDILKKRYAKGEISKEEFEEKKKDLM